MTTSKKKKKSARERRVLVASIICAGLIVAGSTFAWFTSTDEVTNRLSASADYGVTIAEDFTPPENWIPGQEINKDVSAVNTGNVDAFVRMWVEGEMSVFKRTSQTDSVAMPTGTPTALNATTDKKYRDLGFNYVDASKNYYKELSTVKRDNPLNNGASTPDADEDNKPAQLSEVQAMQAGGYLAYVPTVAANYSFKVEQATTIEAYDSKTAADKTTINLKAGDIVATKGSAVASAQAYLDNGTAGINIDTTEFQPETEGVYLFRRNVDLDSTINTTDDYEYSGYYYVPASTGSLISGSEQHYLALYTERQANDSDRSDYTVPDSAVEAVTTASPSGDVITVKPTANMKFFNAKETVVENSALTWAADAATPTKLTATYNGGTTDTDADDIAIDVNLANIGTTGQTWTYIPAASGKMATFYYNDDIEEGDTTAKLIDGVKLADETTQFAYLAFDFDLNVFMESVQVTKNEAGQETTTPVEAGGAFSTSSGNASPAVATQKVADELSDIAWAAP